MDSEKSTLFAEPDNSSVSSSESSGAAEVNNARDLKKTEAIIAACRDQDILQLRSLAESHGGFLNDSMRQLAWPILLGVKDDTLNNSTREDGQPDDVEVSEKVAHHKDEEQVGLDVNRSFVYYPDDQSESELDHNRANLQSLITHVLRQNPYLCYFQGYHDICQVFLLVLGLRSSIPAVSRLSVLRIRDFMLPTLAPTTSQLRLLPEIIHQAAPTLWRHLAGIEPFYALPGTLTMFAHNIERYHDIARLFDILLAREPVFSLYLFAQIVIDRQDEILDLDDPDILHVVLSKVPPNMELDQLITDSVELYNKNPPEKLRGWRWISNASVLKTVQSTEEYDKQTMEEGQAYFDQQVKELRWAETQDKIKLMLWRYRKPARTFGAALAVALVAFYLRRHATALHHVFALFSR